MSYESVKTYFASVGLAERIILLEQSTATVQLAAEAVGCEAKQIAKTMAFLVDNIPVLIVAAGNARVDNQKYKVMFHQKPRMIPGELLLECVGHDLGSVCPFAVKSEATIYLDVSLKQNEIVYPAAGSESSVIRLSLTELEQHSSYKEWIDVFSVGKISADK